jgi:hypothetical protein
MAPPRDPTASMRPTTNGIPTHRLTPGGAIDPIAAARLAWVVDYLSSLAAWANEEAEAATRSRACSREWALLRLSAMHKVLADSLPLLAEMLDDWKCGRDTPIQGDLSW